MKNRVACATPLQEMAPAVPNSGPGLAPTGSQNRNARVIEFPPLLMFTPFSLGLQFGVVAVTFGIAGCFFGQVFVNSLC